MRTEDFQLWLSRVGELTPSQHQQAVERLSQEKAPEEVIGSVIDPNPPCPNCHHEPSGRWGNAHGLPRYRCSACGKTFNALTGTPLAHLRHRECWPAYARAMIAGDTVREAACRCGVHKNTSFRWRHRFLFNPARAKPAHLHGIVEADETYFLESYKGSRDLPRPARKRGGKAAKRGLSAEQIPVLIARDRTPETTDAVLPNANTQAVRAVLEPVLDHDAVLCSDGSAVYAALAKQLHIAHQPVNISAGIRIVNNAYHIQNVNAYDSRLKGWMARFHGVATKYLPNYLGWHRCLDRFSGQLTPDLFLGQVLGVSTNT
jgi:transposase-like protein